MISPPQDVGVLIIKDITEGKMWDFIIIKNTAEGNMKKAFNDKKTFNNEEEVRNFIYQECITLTRKAKNWVKKNISPNLILKYEVTSSLGHHPRKHKVVKINIKCVVENTAWFPTNEGFYHESSDCREVPINSKEEIETFINAVRSKQGLVLFLQDTLVIYLIQDMLRILRTGEGSKEEMDQAETIITQLGFFMISKLFYKRQ